MAWWYLLVIGAAKGFWKIDAHVGSGFPRILARVHSKCIRKGHICVKRVKVLQGYNQRVCKRPCLLIGLRVLRPNRLSSQPKDVLEGIVAGAAP
jgi:hypothetical protein